jgi:hypothetical protein
MAEVASLFATTAPAAATTTASATTAATTAAATTAATSTAAAATTAATTASLLANPWVAGALALTSAGLGLSGAMSQAAAADAAAQQARLAARQEELRGRDEANTVRRTLMATLSAQNARYAAGGVLLDSGTPADVEDATRAEADRQLTISGGNAALRASDQRANATLYEGRASSSRTAGAAGVAGSLLDYGLRVSARSRGG